MWTEHPTVRRLRAEQAKAARDGGERGDGVHGGGGGENDDLPPGVGADGDYVAPSAASVAGGPQQKLLSLPPRSPFGSPAAARRKALSVSGGTVPGGASPRASPHASPHASPTRPLGAKAPAVTTAAPPMSAAAAAELAQAAASAEVGFLVGDRVEVRDPGEDWALAIVHDHEPPLEGAGGKGSAAAAARSATPRCRKDGWDTAYVWDQWRHLDLSESASSGQCPGGHPKLWLFRTPDYGYSCSRCEGVFLEGVRLFGCRTCDFDLCEACLEGRDPTGDPGRVELFDQKQAAAASAAAAAAAAAPSTNLDSARSKARAAAAGLMERARAAAAVRAARKAEAREAKQAKKGKGRAPAAPEPGPEPGLEPEPEVLRLPVPPRMDWDQAMREAMRRRDPN